MEYKKERRSSLTGKMEATITDPATRNYMIKTEDANKDEKIAAGLQGHENGHRSGMRRRRAKMWLLRTE